MLDLNHPQTKFTFAIAREDDAVLSIAKRMTLVCTVEKRELLTRAQDHICQMRQILADGWGTSRKKTDAIDMLQKQVETLAAIPSKNEFVTDWRGQKCTVCDTEIENREKDPDMLYCRKCLDTISTGRSAVDYAFGLCGI